MIEKAISAKTLLCIKYTNADGVMSKHTIEPLALSYQWYAWYLFAYCTQKQDYRLFKLLRIVNCQPAAGCFSKQHGNVEELMKTVSSPDKRKQFRIRLLCKKEIRQQAIEYLGDNIIEECGNGDFVLQLNKVPFERMWFSLLLGFGNQVEVLEPDELRAMLKQRQKKYCRFIE